jgi:hypothetical protein
MEGSPLIEHAQISVEDAEEYTQALGQVFGGGWRLVLHAHKQGVPQALGMSTREWVKERLGGHMQLEAEERKQAVAELTAPEEDGGHGLTQRKAAEVLGVDERTVRRDAAADAAAEPEPEPEPQVEPAAEPDVAADAAPEPEPEEPPSTPPVAAAWQLREHAKFGDPVSKAPLLLDPDGIVPLLDEDDRARVLSSLTNHQRWLGRFEQALRTTTLRVVK